MSQKLTEGEENGGPQNLKILEEKILEVLKSSRKGQKIERLETLLRRGSDSHCKFNVFSSTDLISILQDLLSKGVVDYHAFDGTYMLRTSQKKEAIFESREYFLQQKAVNRSSWSGFMRNGKRWTPFDEIPEAASEEECERGSSSPPSSCQSKALKTINLASSPLDTLKDSQKRPLDALPRPQSQIEKCSSLPRRRGRPPKNAHTVNKTSKTQGNGVPPLSVTTNKSDYVALEPLCFPSSPTLELTEPDNHSEYLASLSLLSQSYGNSQYNDIGDPLSPQSPGTSIPRPQASQCRSPDLFSANNTAPLGLKDSQETRLGSQDCGVPENTQEKAHDACKSLLLAEITNVLPIHAPPQVVEVIDPMKTPKKTSALVSLHNSNRFVFALGLAICRMVPKGSIPSEFLKSHFKRGSFQATPLYLSQSPSNNDFARNEAIKLISTIRIGSPLLIIFRSILFF